MFAGSYSGSFSVNLQTARGNTFLPTSRFKPFQSFQLFKPPPLCSPAPRGRIVSGASRGQIGLNGLNSWNVDQHGRFPG
jgi:hypothetical protein